VRPGDPSLPAVRPEVVFIAGWGRSGSTLLERMLAEIDAFTTVGELFQLWGRVDQRTCACGQALSDCPWWAEVLRSAFGEEWPNVVQEIGDVRRGAVRHRHVAGLLGYRDLPAQVARDIDRYRDAVCSVHQAAACVDAASVVIDASKSPIDLLVLASGESRLRAVHLTRDARGVAASWKRERPRQGHDGGVGTMMQHSAARSAVEWTLRNALVDATVHRYRVDAVSLGYRDMIGDPEASLGRVLALVDRSDPLDFVHGTKVELGGRHALGGNPGRTNTGTIELRVDDGWRDELDRHEQVMVSVLSAPLAWRYPK
jgi:hypothetical protein